ncbi:MAG: mreB [Pseudonocardiales bacterium]|nr:mreB [Pseudonocardiales bacterium]
MNGFGIDLGTTRTVVCHPRHGIVLDVPSVMVVRTDTRTKRLTPLLAGHDARALIGRCPVGLATTRPLRDGVIVDLEAARAFIVRIVPQMAEHRWQRIRPRAVISVPAGSTALERRALLEAAGEAGIRRIRLVPAPIAGALGCGINPLEPRAHMVVDVGGGTAEITGFCFGGILAHRSCRVAGDEMTIAVDRYLRSEHHLIVGELTAESVKCDIASEWNSSLVAQGLDSCTGGLRLVTLSVAEVVDAIRPTVDTIIAALASCLDDLPPQAVNDILQEGVWTFGGATRLRGFDKLIEDAFGFPVRPAERPTTCVAEGAAACLLHGEVLDAFDADVVAEAV